MRVLGAVILEVIFLGNLCLRITDNFFITSDILIDYQKRGIALLGTVRSNRLKRHFEGQNFEQLIKIPKKSNFQRSIRTYQAETGPNKSIHVYFYQDKPSKRPVILTSNDPENIRKCEQNDSLPVSRNLEPKERPVPVKRYNRFMGSVDVVDRLLTKYTIAQKVGNRADKTAYLKKTCTYMFDVIILNVYAFYRIHYLKTNPERKTLPKKFHRNFQLDLAKNLLRKSAPKPPLTELHNPLLGIDLEKENRSPTPIRRAVCHYCVKGNKMRTRNKCHRCRKFICKSHSQTLHLCTDCPTRK